MVPALKPDLHWQKSTNGDILPERATQTRRILRSYVMTWGIAVLLGIAVLAQYASVANLSYQDDRLHMQLAALQRQNQQLTAQAESLSSLQRIKSIAVGKLGMVPAKQVQVVAAPAPMQMAAAPRRKPQHWWTPLEGVASFLAWLTSPGVSR